MRGQRVNIIQENDDRMRTEVEWDPRNQSYRVRVSALGHDGIVISQEEQIPQFALEARPDLERIFIQTLQRRVRDQAFADNMRRAVNDLPLPFVYWRNEE